MVGAKLEHFAVADIATTGINLFAILYVFLFRLLIIHSMSLLTLFLFQPEISTQISMKLIFIVFILVAAFLAKMCEVEPEED